MTENKKKGRILSVLWAGCVLCLLGTGTTAAYLTSWDQEENLVSVGQNTTEIIEVFPDPTPVPVEENPEYTKKVSVANKAEGKNGSQVDCYVRMSIGYSHSDIAKGIIWKDLDTENWIYGKDGYYYFKTPLKEGESTTPLFTGFMIDSSKVDSSYLELIPEFEIQIYEESVQADGFSDYEQAWSAYHASV